jgi:hypothetical protein
MKLDGEARKKYIGHQLSKPWEGFAKRQKPRNLAPEFPSGHLSLSSKSSLK